SLGIITVMKMNLSVICIFTTCHFIYIFLPLLERITDSRGQPCGYWELNPGFLEEHLVVLTAEPSLQTLLFLTQQISLHHLEF
ncbi:mCG1042257, partial [Mus musculus]